MTRSTLIAAILAAAVAGPGGYWVGARARETAALTTASLVQRVRAMFNDVPVSLGDAPAATGPVIYFRDPDGHPTYSLEPRKTASGREYRAVRASEDVVSFEPFQDRSSAPVANERRILFYRNPMGLPDTSPTPKKDSMGMDYIPVFAGDDELGSTIVKIAPGKLQRTGVRSEPATEQIITRIARAPGSVQLDERRITVVSTRSEAYIDNVADVTTGDRVKKGEPLLRLYSPEIANAGAQYISDLVSGGRVNSGARQRLENLGVPPDVIASIERTRQPPLSIQWSSPRDGIVLERNVVQGMKAPPGEVLFRLADLSQVWVVADVPEFDLAGMRVGAPATIRVRSLPGRTFEGNVALIYPQVAKETRTTKVRIELANADGALLPEMYADVQFDTGGDKPVVAVSDSAVIDSGSRQVVILDLGDGRFEPREVQVGARGGGMTEIRKGVQAGDRVVVAANFLIDAESNLKAALRGMTSPERTP